MINLSCALVEETISIRGGTVVSIENPIAFRNVIIQLYNYDAQSTLLFSNHQFKALKKSELLLVSDLVGYELNSATLLKYIYEDLEHQLNDAPEVKMNIERQLISLTESIHDELVEHSLALTCSEMTLLELFKALNVKIDTHPLSLVDKMIEIIQLYQYLPKKKLLIFMNCTLYFTVEELRKIQEYIQLSQLDVLFLEPTLRRATHFLQYEIDDDLYLIKSEKA